MSDDIPIKNKICRICNMEKAADEFSPHPTTKDHLRHECKSCRTNVSVQWQRQTSQQRNAVRKDWRKEVRLEVLRHYSDHSSPRCVCCWEADERFLTIDHIHGGGSAHRKQIGGTYFYGWLKSNGYPSGYQVMCFNCNLAKRDGQLCPHQTDRGIGVVITHPAFVDPGATLGNGVIVWRFATVCAGTIIGRNCVIGASVWIGKDCIIGDRTRIQTGAFIPNGTVIEDDVFIGPNATFTDDRYPQVGNHDYKAEPPYLQRGCSIGANATILPGVTIGAGAMVAAGAVVTHNVPPNELVIGVPARTRHPSLVMQ